jgi:His/Glu/Gln/Arg/opine family amino acid ABC transporter permease subunit
MNLDFSIVMSYAPRLMFGLSLNLYFAFVGFALGCVLGLVCNLASLSRQFKAIVYLYIQIVRGIPFYLLLLWIYFGLASKFGLALSGTQAIIIAIGIMSSAFAAEVFRSGYEAIDPGQSEAGRALGLTSFAINRHILFPQVLRTTIPPLLNILVICFKAATFAAVIAVPELVSVAQEISLNHYRPFEAYITVAVILIVTVLCMSFLASLIERRISYK